MISKDAVVLPYYQQVSAFEGGAGVRKLRKLCAMLAAVLALAAGVTAGAMESAVAGKAAGGELYRLPAEKLKQAQALGRIRPALSFGSEGWEMAALALLLATGGAQRLGRWSE